ncbi:hypothetical protein [Flaviflagellibacter deserti]|uniref:Uncharacterized protein n=1 Tax=Flaviflagellibacter deserti TaxID=2267266 RepID=A0ABV9Z1R9_9HYPH
MTVAVRSPGLMVESKHVLFGIEVVHRDHALGLLSARLGQITALNRAKLQSTFRLKTPVGWASKGVALAMATPPDFGGVSWAAARLIQPVTFERGRLPADLVFAVVGPMGDDLAGRRAVRIFEKLAQDAPMLAALRAATSSSWFCAELTFAFERLGNPLGVMMRE